MTDGGKRTDISPSLVSRVAQAARYAISGVAPDAWFGPMQPLQPMAPAEVAGRRWDYPTGYNLDTRPRGNDPVSFGALRLLADNCDVLRSVIETRKDQMEALDWAIRVKATGDKSKKPVDDDQNGRIKAITTFFQSPDRVSTWSQWQRQLVEDLFVIDAPVLYKRRDRKGRLYALEVVDGATVKILLDDTGRRPLPPDPAYQQILKGVPAVDYTADELLYLMHNPRSNKAYGYSQVEQIIVTINIAIRRSLYQLEYYREGSQPDAFGNLPKEWNVEQIKAFQTWFDSINSGNLASRRKLRFMPGDFKYQEAKQPPLKDAYDEYLARVICHVFSISPEPFVQQVNKGTAETAHDRALKEGLAPTKRWVKGFMDRVIAEEFDSPDLEFAWLDDAEMDPKQAAEIMVNKVKAAIISVDEAREADGKDPLGGAFSIPMLATSSGYVALATPEEQQERAAAAQEASQAAKESGKDGEQAEDGHEPKETEKAAYTRLRKADRPKPVPFDRPVTREARKDLAAKVADVLKDAGEAAAGQVVKALGKVAKADEEKPERGQRIALEIDLGTLDVLIEVVPGPLETVLADSGSLALAQIGVADKAELVDVVNERAVIVARDRAAEMVGKRWQGNELVDHADAEWRIDEATRDELKRIITQGLEENIGQDAIAEAIREAGAFSEARAELIAATEIGTANSVGALEGYKAARDAGVKVKKSWLVDLEPCSECLQNQAAGPIDLEDEFPSGHQSPLAHPRCECTLTPVVEDETETNVKD